MQNTALYINNTCMFLYACEAAWFCVFSAELVDHADCKLRHGQRAVWPKLGVAKHRESCGTLAVPSAMKKAEGALEVDVTCQH